jgi:RNase P/RNase MRP subunit p29
MSDPEDTLRRALLGLHKAVLAAERKSLEGVHGTISSAAFLQIVSDPVRYGWLKPFSELILAFEEDEDERAPAEELRARTKELLVPPKQKTPFGRRYLSLMQREPGLVVAHGELTRLLR